MTYIKAFGNGVSDRTWMRKHHQKNISRSRKRRVHWSGLVQLEFMKKCSLVLELRGDKRDRHRILWSAWLSEQVSPSLFSILKLLLWSQDNSLVVIVNGQTIYYTQASISRSFTHCPPCSALNCAAMFGYHKKACRNSTPYGKPLESRNNSGWYLFLTTSVVKILIMERMFVSDYLPSKKLC